MSNVVLVTVDSLRPDHLGCYGYERDTSPNVDALATGGAAFTGFANASWTRASFPSIITSTYPLEYGGFEYLADQRTTVGSALQNGGYTTGAFHSNLFLARDYNYDRGFDHFFDSKSDPSKLARLRSWLKMNLDHDGIVYRTLQYLYDRTEETAGIDMGQIYKDAEEITDEAIAWLDGVDESFFCWVHYMDVHHPYLSHDEEAEALGVDTVSDREAIRLRRKMLEEPDAITNEEFQTLIDLYDMEIRYMDKHVQRLLETIERQFDEETVVVFTSDHGEEFLEHGRFSHNPTMYEESIAVPIVLGGDGLDGDAVDRDRTLPELLDIAPTCCDLADAPIPDSYRGRSLLWADDPEEEPRVISETTSDDGYKISLRTAEWKFIWDTNDGVEELYDLDADPGERENVATDRPDLVDDFRGALQDHIDEMERSSTAVPDVEMDDETESRLEDLGYLE